MIHSYGILLLTSDPRGGLGLGLAMRMWTTPRDGRCQATLVLGRGPWDNEKEGSASKDGTCSIRTSFPEAYCAMDELNDVYLSSVNTSGGHDRDVFVVDWDGPDDPKNPKNWSFKRKWVATAVVSGFTFITRVSSSMVAPAANQVAVQFNIHSSVVVAFTTSIFVFAFGLVPDLTWVAIGPLFLGPLSEIYGRSRVLQLANFCYLACGFAQNESQLLAFRFLSGLGGSAPLAISGGLLGGCWRAGERGQAIAVYSVAPMLGPVVGPIAGLGLQSVRRGDGWHVYSFRDVTRYWAFSIFKKLMRLDSWRGRQRGYGDRWTWRKPLTEKYEQYLMGKKTAQPIIQLLVLYMAYLHGTLYLFLTTMPSIFEGVYQQPVGIAGLHYIALGIGLMGASQLAARTLDKIYVYLKNKHGGVGKPEFRLPVMFVGLLITGWTVQAHTHWIAPDIGIALIGAGVIFNYQCVQVYIVDAFTLYAASAMASICCLRSIAGCVFPLLAPAMYSALGFGKGYTVLAMVAIVIGCPAPWIFWHFGERIRNASRYAG
ncbi:MFS general substrate transporter [Imleria badia]|nr:MFS general substrate transporter [Imleria badia]